MNVYFANGTNMIVGCDNEENSYYFCQKDGNNYVLYIPEGDVNNNE